MKKALIGCVISLILASFACTSVRHRFVVEGYKKNPGQMIKRIVIVSGPFPQNRDLAGLISAMTRDLIKANRNYLVFGTAGTEGKVDEACKTLDGVLKMSVGRADAAGEHIDLEITGELRRCSDNSAVWNATGRASGKSRNRSLKNLVQNYVEKYGALAELYAAPAYNILQDIVETMPNPELTEDELMEKIDLEISMVSGKDIVSTIGSVLGECTLSHVKTFLKMVSRGGDSSSSQGRFPIGRNEVRSVCQEALIALGRCSSSHQGNIVQIYNPGLVPRGLR